MKEKKTLYKFNFSFIRFYNYQRQFIQIRLYIFYFYLQKYAFHVNQITNNVKSNIT